MNNITRPGVWAALFALMTGAPTAFGCDLCAGKPTDAHLVDGAVAGVVVMIALIALVQVGIVTVIMFWMKRARALEAAAAIVDATPESWSPELDRKML